VFDIQFHFSVFFLKQDKIYLHEYLKTWVLSMSSLLDFRNTTMFNASTEFKNLQNIKKQESIESIEEA